MGQAVCYIGGRKEERTVEMRKFGNVTRVRARLKVEPTVVRVRFDGVTKELDYYNDRFDLRVGDLVFVDGKLEGVRGCVTAVSRDFRIRKEDYKRVVGVADTDVRGRLCTAGSFLITFDKSTLNYEKVRSWVMPTAKNDKYYVNYGGSGAVMDDIAGLGIDRQSAERGAQYFREKRVRFLSLDGDRCRAIVEGTEHYEVELRYADGRVWAPACDCPCFGPCKHEAAAVLQLGELLKTVNERFAPSFEDTCYFAAVYTPLLFSTVIENGTNYVLTLGGAGTEKKLELEAPQKKPDRDGLAWVPQYIEKRRAEYLRSHGIVEGK